MKIKKIKKLSSGKYQIILENGEKIITYDDVIIKNNILYKKELSQEEINELSKNNEYYDIYNDSIKYLSKKVRSKKEFIKFLDKYKLKKNDEEKLINDLENIKLIDDMHFLRAYISDRIKFSNDGPLKIKKQLLEHQIDQTKIDDEISKIPFEDIKSKASKLINKKIKSIKGSEYNIKQKIYSYMNNLGYSKDMIDDSFFVDLDESDNIENDYNKVYNHLVRKESDENRLYIKIKQKLYQKGYSISKIDQIIEKKRN